MDKAFQLARNHGLLAGEYQFNMKYVSMEHFIRRAAEDGLKMKLLVNIFTYDCTRRIIPIRPETGADGESAAMRCGIWEATTLAKASASCKLLN